jgi:VIT1/CCC1 family predicted Fe2+/Mn2+ transporter
MMIQDEYGLALITPNPWKAALATFAAFLFVGLIPLAPFLWNWASAGALSSPFLWSMGATGLAFFCIGAAKSPYVTHSWYRAGLETLAIGAIASALAYGIGVLLKDIAVGG